MAKQDVVFIGLDISINSTAVSIETAVDGKITILSYTNKAPNNIYIKELSSVGVLFEHLDKSKSSDYSDNEMLKIKHYGDTADKIVSDIRKTVGDAEMIKLTVEGYSFTKNTSSILDLVAFSTLIRHGMVREFPQCELKVIAPSSLKLEACKMCYDPINVGIKKPKYEYRNLQGIPGGAFKKPQMFRAMLDGAIESPILSFLRHHSDLMERDKIPNPIEDIIDAIFAMKYCKNFFK